MDLVVFLNLRFVISQASGKSHAGMTLIEVHSSAIRAVGYDGYTLTVEFHSGAFMTIPACRIRFTGNL